MGYFTTQKGYRLYNLANKLFFVSRDVSFREDTFPFRSSCYQSRPPELVRSWDDCHDPFVIDTNTDIASLEPASIAEPVSVPSSPSISPSLHFGESATGVSENDIDLSVPTVTIDSPILDEAPHGNIP